jgi:exodeoxyribonuclease V beta subunit
VSVLRTRPAHLPDPSRRLVAVEASAGTGKTYFLEHRVVDLLLRTPATIDQILLVTFTDKATAELRARIRAKLAELATATESDAPGGAPHWVIDDAARRKLRDAVAGFDRAAIHTIHGFCQRLLVEDAFSGRRLFDQTQVPDDAAFAEAFHVTLREQLAVEPDLRTVLAAYLETGGTVARLREILLACARRGAPVAPALDPVRLVAAADRLVAAVAALPPRSGSPTTFIEAALGTVRGQTKTAMAKRLLLLRDALAGAAGADRAIAIAGALSDKEATEALDYLDGKLDQVTAPIGGGAALRDAARELAAAHVPILAIAAARFLPRVLERVQTAKSRRGQFDFQDMLRLVWEILDGERGPELAARLRKRHPWAMIDEFQDTDELQWRIFGRVWAEGESTHLTIVGDPKQAIYSFRGADVHTYLAARRELEARGALTMALDENWRSSPDLVAAVNALIDGTHGKYFTGGIRYEHPVRAANPAVKSCDGAPVHVFQIAQAPGKTKGLDSPAITDAISQAFADEIHRLLGPGAALRPADIHVLTRSGAHSDAVARALRARGVPCALYQREHLFECDEALELADLLAAIADPRDRSARLRAWTTSFFAVPLAQLETLTEVPDGHPLLALLHDWRGLGLRKDWDALFHRILEDTRWIERTLIAGGGERAVTNVLHLFELLHDDLARSPAELHELEARMRAWIRTGQIDRPDDVDIQRLETEKQAVQIMTIHRAKGLEAPVVFVCGGHWQVGDKDETRTYHDDDGRRWMHVGRAYGAAEQRIDRDAVEENQRLMYVAITRAKVKLYVTVFEDFNLSAMAPIAPLHDRLVSALAARATDPESARLFSSSRVIAGSLAPPPPVEEAADLAGWTPPPPPAEAADPGWEAIRRERGGRIVTSYSKLKHAAARASDRDDARGEEHSSSVALDAAELPAGSESGLFLHEVLEHVPLASAREDGEWQSWAARPDVAPVIALAARRHGIAEPHRRAGARIVHRTLTHPIAVAGETLGTLAAAPRIAREVEFTYPLALPGGREAFARGYVDLLVGWDERLWVVDYKSDAIAAATAAAARPHVERHYAQQSRLYAVAAARLLGLSGEDDCRRRLGGVLYWFLRSNFVVDLPVRWADLAAWTGELASAVTAAHDAEASP